MISINQLLIKPKPVASLRGNNQLHKRNFFTGFGILPRSKCVRTKWQSCANLTAYCGYGAFKYFNF